METPSQIVWRIHGSRVADACESAPGRCWLCAGPMTRGQPVDDWAGALFTGQNRVRNPDGTHVCEACVFVCSRTSPVLGRPPKEGKQFGGNFRNYSHLYDERGYANASKGEKPAIREFLSREHAGPWFAAVADSGQKHVIPWVPMNAAGRCGRVLFDEQVVTVPQSLALVDEMTALLTAGATKEEIERGDYTARAWQMCVDSLRSFEGRNGHERGGAWFSLALWLAQRDEETVQRRIAAEKETKNAPGKRQRAVEKSNRGGAPRRKGRVPRDTKRERAEALGHPADAHAERVEDVRDSRGVGDVPDTEATDWDVASQQLTLFDGAG